MLTLTDSARLAIESILAGTGAPEESGLRFARGQDESSLAVSVTEAPVEGDTVIEDAGARVFLEPLASMMLDDKVLDAEAGPTGGVNFRLETQS